MWKAMNAGYRVLFGSRKVPRQKRTIGPDGKWNGPKGRLKIVQPGRYRAQIAALETIGLLAGLAQPFLLAFFGLFNGALLVLISKWLGNPWAALVIAVIVFPVLWISLVLRTCKFKRRGPMFGSRSKRNWWLTSLVVLLLSTFALVHTGHIMFTIMVCGPMFFALLITAFLWFFNPSIEPLDLRSKKQRRKDPDGKMNYRPLVLAFTFGTEALRAKLEAGVDSAVGKVAHLGEMAQLRSLFDVDEHGLKQLHTRIQKDKIESGKHVLPPHARRTLRPERANNWRRAFKCA